ncbi:MAG TPA: hypothetical protein VM141_10910 [Planctomycetota bacterium]|nr:hypothetical protein [Planctomycetota bacterium]
MKRKIFIIPLIAALAGCEARQLNLQPPDLGSLVDTSKPVTEQNIQDAFTQRPGIRPGANLGIVYIPSNTEVPVPHTITSDQRREWQTVLQDNFFIKDVVFLSTLYTPTVTVRDVRVLRKSAAALNCDLLLVYSVSYDYGRQPNPMAFLYLTVVGLFIFPGDTITAGSMAKGAVLDVRTGYVYGVVEDKAQYTMVIPVAWLQGSLPTMFDKAASLAVHKMREGMRPLLDRLRNEAVNSSQPQAAGTTPPAPVGKK